MEKYTNLLEITSDHPSDRYFQRHQVYLATCSISRYIILLGEELIVFHLTEDMIKAILTVIGDIIDRKVNACKVMNSGDLSVTYSNRGDPFMQGIQFILSVNEDVDYYIFSPEVTTIQEYLI